MLRIVAEATWKEEITFFALELAISIIVYTLSLGSRAGLFRCLFNYYWHLLLLLAAGLACLLIDAGGASTAYH